ncbi:MAG TPA: hypothetical protein VMF50_17880, partial [Candidatus Binataceae bacterium]|nr:hypothetical protein [Candidatus Binataceae bacterium]
MTELRRAPLRAARETAAARGMPQTHPPYPPEYRRRIVELARAGAASTSWHASSSRQPVRSA